MFFKLDKSVQQVHFKSLNKFINLRLFQTNKTKFWHLVFCLKITNKKRRPYPRSFFKRKEHKHQNYTF